MLRAQGDTYVKAEAAEVNAQLKRNTAKRHTESLIQDYLTKEGFTYTNPTSQKTMGIGSVRDYFVAQSQGIDFTKYIVKKKDELHEDGIPLICILHAGSQQDTYYDLQGRPVSEPGHGVYIYKGKKVVK